MRTNSVVALLLVAMVAVNAISIATRDADRLDVESESEFEMAADADAEAWPVWPDLPPYMGADEKGYTCAAVNTIPARFLREDSNANFVNEYTPFVQNMDIGGYPRAKNCDKARATLDMNVYGAGFAFGLAGGKVPDACVAKVASTLVTIGLKLKDVMIAPNSATDPADFIAKLNALGPKVIPVLKQLAAGPLGSCPNVVATINKITTVLSAPNVFTEKTSMTEPQVRSLRFLNDGYDACESSPNTTGNKIVPTVCGYEFGFFSGAALASLARGDAGGAAAPGSPASSATPATSASAAAPARPGN